MKEFDNDQVDYYVNIGGQLMPVVHGGDWVKIEAFAELLQAYNNLKNKESNHD